MKINKIFRPSEWPLSIHIFSLITLLFIIFIALQQLVSYNIFNNFYMNTQIEQLQTEIIIPYLEELRNGSVTPSSFNLRHIAYSTIYDENNISPSIENILDEINFDNDHSYFICDGESSYTKTVCFVDKVNDEFIITLFSIQTTNKMLNTLNTYNIYVYAFILIIIVLGSWYISKKIAKPIENITDVADEIANLNFNNRANENNCAETKALSSSINTLNDNLKEAINQLNIKNEEANELAKNQQKQFAMKKQLVSSISHELKTPLAIMQASISGIIDGVFEPEENLNELKNVLKEINHTNDMVQEVLDVYRLDNDSFTLEIEPLDIVHFTQKIINSFETVLTNSNTKVNFFYEQRNISIDGDYRQLKRVISNLLVNAIKHSPEFSTVDISIKIKNDEILFEICNYGVTIPEEDIKNVFEPFYRVDKSGNRTEKKKGSGLGLYIVREILEKHHFKYGIKNLENGVDFFFYAKKTK